MEEQTKTNQAQKSNTGSMVAIIGLIVIVVAVVIGYSFMNKSSNSANTTAVNQTTSQTSTAPQPSEAMQQAAYKDGTYSVVGNYTSPGGPEELGVSLVLASGVVKDATVEVKATRPMSVKYQQDFADNYKSQVVGKSIDELQLTKVSGSSLAPKGFNDAVVKIKEEAKS